MKENIWKLTLGLAILVLAAERVTAQTQRACAPRDSVLSRLADKYGETRKSIGLGTNNQMVEVFASDDSGSWTITVTLPNGMTCLMATGQAYETMAGLLPAAGTDL